MPNTNAPTNRPAHTVVWLDHQAAQVLRLHGRQVDARAVKAHHHATRQHGSDVRDEHAFFAAVCDALAGSVEVLVAGGHTTQADFKRYIDKRRPAVATRVVGWQPVDHPTEKQLLALAREFFLRHESMAGIALPQAH